MYSNKLKIHLKDFQFQLCPFNTNYTLQNYDIVDQSRGGFDDIYTSVIKTAGHVPLTSYKDWRNNVQAKISLANLLFASYFNMFYLFLMLFGNIVPVLSKMVVAKIRKAINRTRQGAVRELLLGCAYEIMEKEVYFKAGLVPFDWTLGLSVSNFFE